jgi:hypothetical protein
MQLAADGRCRIELVDPGNAITPLAIDPATL